MTAKQIWEWVKMTDFERFARDHSKHKHCISCGGCILDQSPIVLNSFPILCVGCFERLEKALPKGANPPWISGWVRKP
jgi:hypothetical protein